MANTVTHPTAVTVARREPVRDRRYTPQVSVRVPVNIQPELAPKPVDDTAFAAVGKTFEHAWPHIVRYQALAIADKLAVAQWPFQFPKAEPGSLVIVPSPHNRRRFARPVVERKNIDMAPQTSAGAIASVSPYTSAIELSYAKLT